MGKRICTKVYRDVEGKETRTPDGGTIAVVLKFLNGRDVVVSMPDLSDEIKHIAAAHGIAQKVGDAFAEAQGDTNLAHGLAQNMANRLEAGEWNIRGEGGASATLLAEALANVTGRPLAEVIGKINDMEKAEKEGLQKHPQIVAEIAKLQAERAAQKAQAAAALAADSTTPLPI